MLWEKTQAPSQKKKDESEIIEMSSINDTPVHHRKNNKKNEAKKKGQYEPRPWRRMRRFSSVPSSLGV
jgi:hypothetical protein